MKYLGGAEAAGIKLKYLSGWHTIGNGDNSSIFNAMPDGFRSDEGTFYYLRRNGYCWITTMSLTYDA